MAPCSLASRVIPRITDSVNEWVRRAVCMKAEVTRQRPRRNSPGPSIYLPVRRPHLREIPEPDEVGAAPVHEGDCHTKDAASAVRPTRRGSLMPGGVGRQHLADGIGAARDTGENVVVPLYVKGYPAGYRGCDDRVVPVPELDAPTREIGKTLGRVIYEHLAQDRPGPCAHGVHAPGRWRDRAARGVHSSAKRRIGALVEIVRHPVPIGVEDWGLRCA